MTWRQSLVDDLWSGEKSICFFVHSGKCFWVADDKFNFSLDAERDYRAYLDKGHINLEQYTSACISFRGGILKLTAESFLKYLMAEGRQVLSKQELKDIFTCGLGLSESLYGKIEGYYFSGAELSAKDFGEANAVASRLPMFYVNFDRKIYMHMDYGRGHEDLAYSDWFAKCSDFCYLVPDREKYWVLGGMDFWKYRFLQLI
ncbi:hypothetical protein [Pseudomonas oryzihabitans]|uniref:hypothetical protein n=1 Tax=Pseudomonas oryzihabitans TaxID=47885 RepID=UPI00111D5A32|nr:hypothetical protein [Pseudomonas psychrotolerans]QDD90645.1 hypothetical protein CCZ28_17135 [Pseudomonas psychrotolerans]